MFQHIKTINDDLLSVCPKQLYIINTVVLIKDCVHIDTNWSTWHYTETWLILHTHMHTTLPICFDLTSYRFFSTTKKYLLLIYIDVTSSQTLGIYECNKKLATHM